MAHKRAFLTLLKQYEPFIEAVVKLFHPFVEAAVHDLEKGVVLRLYHNISKRKEGERSPLKELGVDVKDFPAYFTPYYKQNWDGRSLKCTSITMRDEKGKAVGLICLNVDTSFFQEGKNLLEAFLKTEQEAANPVEIYGGECQELAERLIQDYLEKEQLSLRHLTREKKQELVQHLFRKGLFNFKKAAPYVAKKLNLSRASVYNYLKS